MASYTSIIAAIDDAIADWAGKPISISTSGRSTTYRSLDELLKARRYYAQLAANSAGGKPFRISHLKSGSAR